MNRPIPLAVFGQSGRMASAIWDAAGLTPGYAALRQIPARGCSRAELTFALAQLPPDCVICDLTHPVATAALLDALSDHPRKLVLGTSGLTAAQDARIAALAQQVAVIRGCNFCLGAAMTRVLLAQLARLIGGTDSWDAAIVDFHHRHKQDPVSATAQDWAQLWHQTRGGVQPNVSTLRLGDGVSEHAVMAAGTGERIELWHKVQSRSAPVSGVLAAARFIAHRPSGLYGPEDLFQNPPPNASSAA